VSGGEKARLVLGLATFAGPHLIILDEPTNHLDIDSRAALIEAINDYPGAVILVSHDRYLLDACAERLLLVSGGAVTAFDGDLSDYQRRILSGGDAREDKGERANGQRMGRADIRRAAAEKRAELAPLRRRIATAEASVSRLTTEIESLDLALATPNLFASDPAKATVLAKARSDHAAKLAAAEEEWLSASSAYEVASAQ
jgi:ATP-binding cassette subfamily F protein 3